MTCELKEFNDETKIHIFIDWEVESLERELLLERIGKIQNWETIDKYDVFRIKWLNDEEIVKLVEEKLNINIVEKSWIQQLNQIFQEALIFYNQYLYRSIPRNLQSFQFRNKQDVIDFLRRTEKEWNYRQIYCNIAKTCVAVNDILNDKKLKELDKKWERLIKNTILTWMQISDIREYFPNKPLPKEIKLKYTKDLWNWKNKVIDTAIRFRAKSEESVISKSIWMPWEKIKDEIAMEFVCKNEEDIIYILEYLFINLYNKKIWEFKQANLIDNNYLQWFLNEYWHFLDNDFKNTLKELKLNTERKNTNTKFKDIKFNWWVDIPEDDQENALTWNHMVEARCILENNKNEQGLANHKIREWSKRIFAMIRLQWYVSEIYIKRVVDEIKKKYSLRHNDDKIFEFYISKLYKIYTANWGKKIYTTPNRWKALSWTNIYPKKIINATDYNGKSIEKFTHKSLP